MQLNHPHFGHVSPICNIWQVAYESIVRQVQVPEFGEALHEGIIDEADHVQVAHVDFFEIY